MGAGVLQHLESLESPIPGLGESKLQKAVLKIKAFKDLICKSIADLPWQPVSCVQYDISHLAGHLGPTALASDKQFGI